MQERLGNKLADKEYEEVRNAILKRDVCPSMRLLWGSGKATIRSPVASEVEYRSPACRSRTEASRTIPSGPIKRAHNSGNTVARHARTRV